MFSMFRHLQRIKYVVIRSLIHSHYPDIPIHDGNFTKYNLELMDKHSDCTYLIDADTGRRYSFQEIASRIRRLSRYLRTECDIRPKDPVAVIARNSVDYITVVMAAIGCDGVAVPVNPMLTAYEVGSLLQIVKPAIVFGNSANLQVMRKGLNEDSVKKFISMDKDGDNDNTVFDIVEPLGNCSSSSEIDETIGSSGGNSVCLNIFSSGTTGVPKAIELTHRNLLSSSLSLAAAKTIEQRSCLVGFLPFSHIYALIMVMMQLVQTCSSAVVMSTFNLQGLIDSIQRYQINHIHIVPPVALYLLNHPGVEKCKLGSVSRITVGAAPIDSNTEQRLCSLFRAQNPNFVLGQGYGLSETTGVVSVVSFQDEKAHKKVGSIGQLLPNFQLKVMSLDDTDKELGPMEVGEILVKGPNVMKGYVGIDHDDPRSGWKGDFLSTGDVGYYDEDHYLYISDRIKELIKVKGFQVAPAELEGFLLTHPGIADCGVVGLPHSVYGEVPQAFVVRKKGHDAVTAEEIQRFVTESLSDPKHLRGGVQFLDAIPKSASGKIMRKNLKQLK